MDFGFSAKFDEGLSCWKAIVSGEIDIFSAGAFKDELMTLIREREADICLSCGNLEYIDSTALGALVSVYKTVASYGGKMKLTALKPNIVKLFRITNLDTVFALEGDASGE